jgi:ubiquinone/menaquinone biosynthesis C-methylase UbiE
LPFADNSFNAVFHFGGVNLFYDPDQALKEFVRVIKSNGLVCWINEGLSQNYQSKFRRKLLTKLNPDFLKPIPEIPGSVYGVQVYKVYDGLGYLVVARKK